MDTGFSSISVPYARGRSGILQRGGSFTDLIRFRVHEQTWAFATTPGTRTGLLQSFTASPLSTALETHLSTPDDPSFCYMVQGMGGSGKTALAWHLMETMTWRHSDGLVVLLDAAEINTQTTPLSFAYHWANAIARALVLYLLDPRHANAELSVQDVLRIQQAGGLGVERLLSSYATADDRTALVWDTLRRPLWEDTLIHSTTLLRQFSLSTDPLFTINHDVSEVPIQFLQDLPQLCTALGINKVFVFVDNVTDTITIDPTLQWYLKQLMQLPPLGPIPLIRTLFVTPSAADTILALVPTPSLFPESHQFTIAWNGAMLREMAQRRSDLLCVPSVWGEKILRDAFAGPSLPTPRDLLQYVGDLLLFGNETEGRGGASIEEAAVSLVDPHLYSFSPSSLYDNGISFSYWF